MNPDADDCDDYPRRLDCFDAEDFHGAQLPDPRPFQAETIEALKAGWMQGHRCQLVMAPPGAGKTALSMMIMGPPNSETDLLRIAKAIESSSLHR